MHEKQQLAERVERLVKLGKLKGNILFIFGHSFIAEEIVELLMSYNYYVEAILDNNPEKLCVTCRGVKIISPITIKQYDMKNASVIIASRFFEEMNAQLISYGYNGTVIKLLDFNSFAEYSLSKDTIVSKLKRLRYGKCLLYELNKRHEGFLNVFCPFAALGDIYIAMSYLPTFLMKRRQKAVIIVSQSVLSEVVGIFGDYRVEVLPQRDMEAMIQAALFYQFNDCFVAHQDRPYVINLHGALYVKQITLDLIYRCGVFGLPLHCKPLLPYNWIKYKNMGLINENKAVILSPYAKSVISLPKKLWCDIARIYINKGFQVFTNVFGNETPIRDTIPISPSIKEMKSVVERAGCFVGIRSGLCDVIRTAKCRKIALYPDYNYSDTVWKAIDMYYLDEFENIVVYDSDDYEPVISRIMEGFECQIT